MKTLACLLCGLGLASALLIGSGIYDCTGEITEGGFIVSRLDVLSFQLQNQKSPAILRSLGLCEVQPARNRYARFSVLEQCG